MPFLFSYVTSTPTYLPHLFSTSPLNRSALVYGSAVFLFLSVSSRLPYTWFLRFVFMLPLSCVSAYPSFRSRVFSLLLQGVSFRVVVHFSMFSFLVFPLYRLSPLRSKVDGEGEMM